MGSYQDSYKEWSGYSNQLEISYSEENRVKFLTHVLTNCGTNCLINKSPQLQYYNIPCAFDIETSSWETIEPTLEYVPHDDLEIEKHACMYIWQFGMDCSVIYGRTWDEFFEFLHFLVDTLNLSRTKRLIIYVHNLSYEFQFIRKWVDWDKVFTTKRRRPLYAISGGIEFRCSYFLSNYALSYIGDNLLYRYPMKKLTGSLDYSLLRGSETPLSPSELAYCINDVKVLNCYIRQKIEEEGSILSIPLTNTGYVRNYCREWCFGGDPNDEFITPEEREKTKVEYHRLMKSLQISSPEEYYQMKRAFQGGFTHASAMFSGRELYSNQLGSEIGSADLTSSYPYNIVSCYFPMSPFEYVGTVTDLDLFGIYLRNYCCMFNITFHDLKPKVLFENILSSSHCIIPKEATLSLNNGRIVSCSECTTTITELDYFWLEKFYTWSSIEITELRISIRDYLPKDLILSVLNLYARKTSLKGVEEKHVEYMVSKNMINAAFGMMCTDIAHELYEYTDDWLLLPPDIANQLESYNNSYNRFLFYGWGVWVTAHARDHLFQAIYEFQGDYVYSDTDSIKGLFFEEHSDFFKKYNDNVELSLARMCSHYNIPFSLCNPSTIKGEHKLIGVWEIERSYKRFKTCGAKRYIVQYADNDEISITVGGLGKKAGLDYLIQTYQTPARIFAEFGEGMCIPRGHTGKQTLSYIDDADSGTFIDYLGNECHYNELSATHMKPARYYMSLLTEYKEFIEGLRHVEY